MLPRRWRIKLFLWGTVLAVLGEAWMEAEAQPPPGPPGPSEVKGILRGPEGPLPEKAATVSLTLEEAGEEGDRAPWSEEQSLQPEGRFHLPQVPVGKHRLDIQVQGRYQRDAQLQVSTQRDAQLQRWKGSLQELTVEPGETYEWTVQLVFPDPSMVGGTVYGPENPLPAKRPPGTLTLEKPEEGIGTISLTLEEPTAGEDFDEWSEKQPLPPGGNFLFSEVPPGKYELRVQVEGFVERVLGVVVQPGQTYDWELHLRRPQSVRGRILREDGTLLAHTSVELTRSWTGWRSRSSTKVEVATDAQGGFEFPVEDGRWTGLQLLVTHSEEGYAFSPVLSFPWEGAPKEVDLCLQPGYTLTGVARGIDTQAPLPNLELTLEVLGYLEGETINANQQKVSTTTDATGSFTFRNLPPGMYQIGVPDPLAPYAGIQRIWVMKEKEISPLSVDWELPKNPTPALTLLLNQPDGTPFSETQVRYRLRYDYRADQGRGGGTIDSRSLTDAQGRLKLPLQKGIGTYQVTLTVEGYQPTTVENIFLFGCLPGPESEITLQEAGAEFEVFLQKL